MLQYSREVMFRNTLTLFEPGQSKDYKLQNSVSLVRAKLGHQTQFPPLNPEERGMRDPSNTIPLSRPEE